MLSTNLSLDKSDGVEVTYNLQSYLPDGARRIDVTSSTAFPNLLTVQHTSSGKVPVVTDRHLISATKSIANGANPAQKATVNLTIAIPRGGLFGTVEVADLVSVIIDLISDGGFSAAGIAGTANLAAILRGES